jgi:eukaryotic-like serine/threonine-protein kinase
MTPERWKQIQDNLNIVTALAPSERESFLNELRDTDPELKGELESLLSFESTDPNFLRTAGVRSLMKGTWQEAKRTSMLGRVFGSYRLTELLGSGGMGDVYRAVRVDGQYDQQVALKIVRPDFAGELAARFRHERQILASLDHPNIARIFDGNTTEDGVPYLVMELIEGLPITEYCNHHHLSIDERLKLFRTMCSTVHYAHQHLVVHRDIKPGNILVTADGTPKLLDFGIAKILGPDLVDRNSTRTGQLMMTPEYASPEQLRGEPITTATDVYSLGLVLYELLIGCHPFRVRGDMPHEIARGVLEMEAERPSAALRRRETEARDGEKNSAVTNAKAEYSHAPPDRLGRRLSGDIDSIVLKALRKEPHERYSSADQISEDIRRHLEGLPVLAREGTVSYRAFKYVLRHKVGVASAAFIVLSLATGLVLTVREARIAHGNELRAERRFNDVHKLANSLLFDIHDSVKDLPGSTPARKLIVQNALQYLDSLSSEAGGDASLQRELATAYERVGEVQGDYIFFNVGETENALRSYQKALSLRKDLAASTSATWQDQLALAKTYKLVGRQMQGTGDVQNALPNIQASVSISELLRKSHPQDKQVLAELANAYQRLGYLQRGSSTQALVSVGGGSAIESFGKALVIDKLLLQLDPSNEDFQLAVAADETYYAEMLPQNEEKLEHFQHVLDVDEKMTRHSPSPQKARNVAVDYTMIAMWYDAQRDHAKSAENHRHSVEIYEHLLAADPQNGLVKRYLASESGNLGLELGLLGQKKESEGLLNNAITLMQSLAQAEPQNTSYKGTLAAGFIARGDNFLHWKNFKAGLDDYAAAINVYRQLLAVNSSNTSARRRLLICRIAVAHTKLQAGTSPAAGELESALKDLIPLLSDAIVSDDTLYAAAAGYADLGKVEVNAARNSVAAARKSHWESAAHWYGLSLTALKRVQDLASQSESEEFGAIDPAQVSRRLAICESAMSHTSHSN